MHAPPRLALAVIVATIAFWAYTQTLLPGVDLGDTGGFQAAVLWPEVSARQAYPLYYTLAKPFVAATTPSNPARALNLASALWGSLAVGLLTFLVAAITQSLAAGAAGGLLLAFSYTFWTQAIIAEVYTLQLTFIAACMLALWAYAARPSTMRLAMFFAIYALSFGNHLGMILWLVPFAIFLFQVTPDRRTLFAPRVIALALLIAAVGALQYAPNYMAAPDFASFWFDATRQDWRQTMVLGVPASQALDRLGMWWFDARQQFGIAGIALAIVGLADLWRFARPWAVLALTGYVFATGFALTYNVGDAHVFFLPGHLITALCAGASVSFVARTPRALLIVAVLGYAGWRGWSTWPAVDRHADHRGEQLIARETLGLSDRDALFVPDMNWQIENVLLYTGRYLRPDIAWVRLGDVMTHLPFLVEDNHAIGRDIVLNETAARAVIAVYGEALPVTEDPVVPVITLAQAVAQVPRGFPYVLCVLSPPRETPIDADEFDRALMALTGGHIPARSTAAYQVIAGVAGEQPQLVHTSERPFTDSVQILDEPLTVRMDSWLPSDTFRRAGFGHVLRRRDHVMILERGVNLVSIGSDGNPSAPYYASSLYAAEPRFRIPAATLQLAYGGSGLAPRPGNWLKP